MSCRYESEAQTSEVSVTRLGHERSMLTLSSRDDDVCAVIPSPCLLVPTPWALRTRSLLAPGEPIAAQRLKKGLTITRIMPSHRSFHQRTCVAGVAGVQLQGSSPAHLGLISDVSFGHIGLKRGSCCIIRPGDFSRKPSHLTTKTSSVFYSAPWSPGQ